MNSLVKQFTKSAITINKNLFTKYIRLNSSSSKQSTADDSIPNQTEEGDQDIERIIKVAPPVRPLNEPLSIKRARLLCKIYHWFNTWTCAYFSLLPIYLYLCLCLCLKILQEKEEFWRLIYYWAHSRKRTLKPWMRSNWLISILSWRRMTG